MAVFLIAFDYMLPNEDYAPDDPRFGQTHTDNNGGLVRFGVNSRTYGHVVPANFYSSMPNEQAILVAQNLYNIHEWSEIHGGAINAQNIASKIFDMSVNMGSPEAAKLTQRAVLPNFPYLDVDGVIGKDTVTAINGVPELVLMPRLVQWWLWFIKQEVIAKPQDAAYVEDWKARAEKLPSVA